MQSNLFNIKQFFKLVTGNGKQGLGSAWRSFYRNNRALRTPIPQLLTSALALQKSSINSSRGYDSIITSARLLPTMLVSCKTLMNLLLFLFSIVNIPLIAEINTNEKQQTEKGGNTSPLMFFETRPERQSADNKLEKNREYNDRITDDYKSLPVGIYSDRLTDDQFPPPVDASIILPKKEEVNSWPLLIPEEQQDLQLVKNQEQQEFVLELKNFVELIVKDAVNNPTKYQTEDSISDEIKTQESIYFSSKTLEQRDQLYFYLSEYLLNKNNDIFKTLQNNSTPISSNNRNQLDDKESNNKLNDSPTSSLSGNKDQPSYDDKIEKSQILINRISTRQKQRTQLIKFAYAKLLEWSKKNYEQQVKIKNQFFEQSNQNNIEKIEKTESLIKKIQQRACFNQKNLTAQFQERRPRSNALTDETLADEVIKNLNNKSYLEETRKIRERFGNYAEERFKYFFHTEIIDSLPLDSEKIKEFYNKEEELEDRRNSGYKSLVLSKDSIILELNKIYQRSLAPQCENDQQKKDNKSTLISSDENLDNGLEEQMALNGIRVVLASLENQEIAFLKDMPALKQQDVLARFYKTFYEKKNKLTVDALESFFREELEKKEQWLDKLYYTTVSAPHKMYNSIWSATSGVLSAIKAQPIITQLGYYLFGWDPEGNANFTLGTGSSIVITGAVNATSDELRPYIKPPEDKQKNLASKIIIPKENISFEDAVAGFFISVEEIQKKAKEIRNESLYSMYDVEGNFIPVLGNFHESEKFTQNAYKEREDFVNRWIENRPEQFQDISNRLSSVSTKEQEKQEVIDSLLSQELFNNINETIIVAHEQLSAEKQHLDHLGDSQYISKEAIESVRKKLEERQADLFTLEVEEVSPQSQHQIEQILHSLHESQNFFLQKIKEIDVKIIGGEKRTALPDLTNLRTFKNSLSNIEKAYDQLGQAYLLKLKTILNQKNYANNSQEPLFKVITEWLEGDSLPDDSNYITTCGRTLTTTLNKEEANNNFKWSVALLKIFLENRYGLDGVKHFEWFISNKKQVTKQDFKKFIALENKFHNSVLEAQAPPPSFYISSRHSMNDLLPSSEQNKKEVIRSNGHQLVYNSFLTNKLPEGYLTDEKSTAEEGVRAVLQKILQMDFYKNTTALNRLDILKSFKSQFQDESETKKVLTREALEKFINDEGKKQQQSSTSIYYKVFEPSNAKWWWGTGFMGLISAIRVQPLIQSLGVPFTFFLTLSTDVAGELYSLRRESERYNNILRAKEKEMLESAKMEPLHDLYWQFKKEKTKIDEAMRKAKDRRDFQQWRVEVEKTEKLNRSFREKISIADTVDIAEALNKIEEGEELVTDLFNDFQSNLIFSKEDLAAVQKRIRDLKEKFLFQQSRSAYDLYQLKETQLMAANNAAFFKQEIERIKVDTEAMKCIQDSNNMESANLNNLLKLLEEFHERYNDMANAYAAMSVNTLNGVSENIFSQIQEAKENGIISYNNGRLVIKDPNQQEQTSLSSTLRSYDYGARLVKLAIADHVGLDFLPAFESEFENDLRNKNPLEVKKVQDFLKKFLRTEQNTYRQGYVLSPGHSLEELFHENNRNVQGPIMIEGLQEDYNPFSSQPLASDKKVFSAEKKLLSSISEESKKMRWFNQLTPSNKRYVLKCLEEQIGNQQSITAEEFRSFVKKQEEERQRWSSFYDVCDNPILSSVMWNVITGLGVTLRSQKWFINCAFGFITIPVWLHWVPSFVLAYIVNYLGYSWVHLRQLPLHS